MGSDHSEVVQVLQKASDVKVHCLMCGELTKILNRIDSILPAIESARPGCTSGIKELCSLNSTIEKAQLLLQHCAEASKLYLAITGETILIRCQRIRTSLDQSLCQIQNMVPQLLACQISDFVNYLRDVKFIIDSTEEEAGKAMLELLRQTDSNDDLEFEAFQSACLKLNITAPKAFLIESRSIKKLLGKIRGTDPDKEAILNYLLILIMKYRKKVKPDANDYKENASAHSIISITNSKSSVSNSANNDVSTDQYESQTDLPSSDGLPEEFCCPISSRLMYDPVVISSGQTYERTFIEKWFSEGHDTCPKTQKKLENLSVIENTCMKDLIFRWCKRHNVDIQDLCSQPNLTAFDSWEPSISNSISSLKNVSIALLYGNRGDCIRQNDHSNVSYISSEGSYCSDISHVKDIESIEDSHDQLFSWSDDYKKFQSFSHFNHDMFLKFLYRLSELPVKLQGKEVEDVKTLLEDDEEICYSMLSNGCVEALMNFLKNGKDLSDIPTQKIGAQILHSFLSNRRFEISSLNVEEFQLMTSFLHSEITPEALMIMQKLVHHPNCISYIQESGVPPSVLEVLDVDDIDLKELVLKIIYHLSSHSEIKSHILSSGCMSKLVPLLGDKRLAGFCVKIMRNLCDNNEALQLIAETEGCLASIAELLESGDHEEQEHAVAILHVLCSHSFGYCQLVMLEGIIPALVHISINGNPRGKESSMKLLYHLRDLRESSCSDSSQSQYEFTSSQSQSGPTSSQSQSGSTSESSEDCIVQSVKAQPTSKSIGSLGKRRKIFQKFLLLF